MKQAIIKRLRELASGAPPKNTLYGVCNDLAVTVLPPNADRSALYDGLGQVFLALGYPDTDYPLGRVEFHWGKLWIGEAAANRRLLARRCAEYLKAHPEFEFGLMEEATQ